MVTHTIIYRKNGEKHEKVWAFDGPAGQSKAYKSWLAETIKEGSLFVCGEDIDFLSCTWKGLKK